jgi:hypothetical protein
VQSFRTRSGPPGDGPDEGVSERRGRAGPVLGAAAATALVIVVLNHLGTGAATGGFPVPDRTALPLPTTVAMVEVPPLVTRPEAVARGLLDDRLLAADVIHRFVACNPSGLVVEQDPLPGTRVPAGESVSVVVTDSSSEQLPCPRGVALDLDRAVADGFYDFSRGVAAYPPTVTSPVTLGYLGGAGTALLSGREAADVDSWRVTPPGGAAGDAVPILGPLAASAGAYRVDVGPHPVCVGPNRPAAAAFAGLRQVSITPTTPRGSCVGWWALDLFVDPDTGRVRGANLDVWEP